MHRGKGWARSHEHVRPSHPLLRCDDEVPRRDRGYSTLGGKWAFLKGYSTLGGGIRMDPGFWLICFECVRAVVGGRKAEGPT